MSRPRAIPFTALAVAIRARGGNGTLRDLAQLAGVPVATMARIERGRGIRSANAQRLALWLGWTVAQVWEAARTPAATCASCGQVVTTKHAEEPPCP